MEPLLSAVNGVGPANTAVSCWSAARPPIATSSTPPKAGLAKEAYDEVFAGGQAQALLGEFGALLAGKVQYADELPVDGKATIN